MKSQILSLFVLALFLAGCTTPKAEKTTQWPEALLPLQAAPKQHKVMFENERVRVFEVFNPPGGIAPLHVHAVPSVIIIDEPARVRERNAAGEILREHTPTGAYWAPPSSQPYSVENIDDKPIRLYRVEFKQE